MALLLLGPEASARAQPDARPVVVDSVRVDSLVRVHPSRPPLRVYLLTDADGAYVGAAVLDARSGTFRQRLVVPGSLAEGAESTAPPRDGPPPLKLVDLNADGYRDLGVVRRHGSGGTLYSYWIYDPFGGQFSFNEALSTTCNLERTASPPRVRGCCTEGDGHRTCRSYRAVGMEVELVRTAKRRPAPHDLGTIHTIRERTSGRLRVVCQYHQIGTRRVILKGTDAACVDGG